MFDLPTLALIAVSCGANIILCMQLRQALSRGKQAEQQAFVLLGEKSKLEQLLELSEYKLSQALAEKQQQTAMQEQAINSAKAAIFTVGQQLSAELINQHKQESNQQREHQQKAFTNLQQQYQEQLNRIISSVGALEQQVSSSKRTVEVVRQALLSPHGAGSLAELTLENILKNSGLVSGLDYFLQPTLTTETATYNRPDAIIFTPGDNVLVIDCKASKFFLEIAETTQDESSKLKLNQMMRQHLKDLYSRDYQDALKHTAKLQQRRIRHASILMFLPSESAIETIRKSDPEFLTQAWRQHIYPVGPVGLINILSHAHLLVAEAKQAANYEIILEEITKLVSSLGTLHEHGMKLGNSVRGLVTSYDKFAASFNSNLVSKANKLGQLGLSQGKISSKRGASKVNQSNKLQHLERYQLMNNQLIEIPESDNAESAEASSSNAQELLEG